LPIQYALGYPSRLSNDFQRFSFLNYPTLSFEQPDLDTFKCLQLAYLAMRKGGNASCVLNAANEIAVDAFLKDKISFLSIPELISACLEKITFTLNPGLEDLVHTDTETRIFAENWVKNS